MQKTINMNAGALSWGTERLVYSVFGSNTGCKINIVQNNTNGNIRIQIQKNEETSWEEYFENTHIDAQVVKCRLMSNSTGGSVIIQID